MAPQPSLLAAEDAHFGEDVHQVAVAEPAVPAGTAPPPAGGRPVPVLLPRLPLLADQAAGDGRGHGGPGTGSGGGRGRGEGAGDTEREGPARRAGRRAGAGGWERSVPPGTHRPLRGARGRARKCAQGAAGRTPGARGRARRRRRRVGAGTGAGAGAAGAAARAAFLPGPPPGREVEPVAFFPGKGWRAGAGRVPRVGPPRARWAGLRAGLERPPGPCRRCRPLSESTGDRQVPWRSASGERNLLPGDLKSERFVPSPLHSPPVPLLGQSSEGKKKVYI